MDVCISTMQLGLTIQLIGVIIIMAGQAVFIVRARRKYHIVRGAFLDMAYARFDGKEVSLMNEAEIDELAQKFPIVGFLWEDFWVSLLGLVLTLLGLIIGIV